MKRKLVIYTTKPEHTAENARLIGRVFDELRTHAPAGLRYLVLRCGEGRFAHFVEERGVAPTLADFEAFRAFQKSASERWLVRPEVSEVAVLGSYGILPDAI
jgi:hypothetical protein